MIAVVSNDAGGAEILSSWVLKQHEPYCLAIDGPAKNIFKRKIGNIENNSLESTILTSDWLITGTSCESILELNAIKLARDYGKKSVSFLDHWCNYDQRFSRDELSVLPDEIWVGDKSAYAMAKKVFPETSIILKSNPYFESLEKEIELLNKQNKTITQEPYILYVSTPLNEHALKKYGDEKYWGYTEEEAIRYLMDHLYAIEVRDRKVVLRPHPSEKREKYDWTLDEFGSQIKIGGKNTLLEEIINADIIVGCNSMAMVTGLIAGKRVISGLPPGHRTYSLPMPEIEHLQELIEQYQSG